MTAPIPPKQTILGPGTLTLGEVATPIDVSCLVNAATLIFDKEEGDPTKKLCGTEFPGAISYTAKLTGNIDQDPTDPAGVLATSWANPGAVVPFTFIPNTDAGTEAAGELILDPLSFGGETYGEIMTADIEWTVVGEMTLTQGGAALTLTLGQPILGPGVKRPGAKILPGRPAPAPAEEAEPVAAG